MPDLTDWSQTDRAILTDSPAFRARFRQVLVQAATDISSEESSDRTQLARSVLSATDAYAAQMIAATVVNLAGTDDDQILEAIGGVWDAFI